MASTASKADIVKYLKQMKVPTPLLKFGSTGKPKFRSFALSVDNRLLVWTSQSKNADETKIALADVAELVFGQRTEKFKRTPRPDLEHLSFSLTYRTRKGVSDEKEASQTLDLVCKDEAEFQCWTQGLLGLIHRKLDASDLSVEPSVRSAASAVAGGASAGTATVTSGSVSASLPLTPSARLQRRARIRRMGNDVTSGIKGGGSDLKSGVVAGQNDLYSCGWGYWGQDAIGKMVDVDAPSVSQKLLGKGVVQVAVGWSHTSVLTDNGSLLQVGNRVGTGLADDCLEPMEVLLPPQPDGLRPVIAQISCGYFHSACVSEFGDVYTWGCNLRGQIGNKSTIDVRSPYRVEVLAQAEPMLEVVCGNNATAAISASGRLYTWGSNDHGQLGHNDSQDRWEPVMVADLQGFTVSEVAAGESHMVATTDDREVFSWGWNGCGQLGLGHYEDCFRPQAIDAFRGADVVEIKCGVAHCMAIVNVVKLSTHVLYAWGANSIGQLGLPHSSKANVLKPTPVQSVTDLDMVELACGAFHSAVISANGEVYTTGANNFGQVGHPEIKQFIDCFRNVAALKEKQARGVICGGHTTCVIVATDWMPDDETKVCMSCHEPFSMLNRRHHCRRCKSIFCSKCSSRKAAILQQGVTEPVRVCDACYEVLTAQR